MQLKIYQRLNQILLGLIIITLAIIGVIIFNFGKLDGTAKILIVIGFFVFTLVAILGFKTLEYNWDKYLIQKMILRGQVALAEIKSANPLYQIKDSSSKFYRLFQVEVVMKDLELQNVNLTVYEKFNINVRSIPNGNVYITYDAKKPNRLFIIPNGMIARFPSIAPIISFYENAGLKLKYLDVLDDEGLVIRTFKESLKIFDNQKNSEVKPQTEKQ
ncbi:hypothetical protein SDC9_144585 [bioreactor metagenome]|uniref:Uncharacterized protein n=1 Tax=bioreactor metagenome TaxID=1076179 RepID=A0A645E9V6_9ZZZZ